MQILVIRTQQYINNKLNNLGRDTATAKANYCGPKFPTSESTAVFSYFRRLRYM